MNLRSNIWFISLSVLPMLIDFSLHVLWNSIDVYRRKLTNRELGFSSNLGKISQRVMDEEEEEASRRNLIKRGPSSLVFLNLIGLSRFNLNVIVGSTRFNIKRLLLISHTRASRGNGGGTRVKNDSAPSDVSLIISVANSEGASFGMLHDFIKFNPNFSDQTKAFVFSHFQIRF